MSDRFISPNMKAQSAPAIKATDDDPTADVRRSNAFTHSDLNLDSDRALTPAHGMRNRISDALAKVPSALNRRKG